jgi:DNA-nicking Smr family endonuclease
MRRSIRFDAVEVERDQSRKRSEPAPVEVNLRRLRADDAMTRLEAQLRSFSRMGKQEVLVVHGQGHNSPLGQPVLKNLVRQWCDDHPAVVHSWREAPREWGGAGAIVVQLNRGE